MKLRRRVYYLEFSTDASASSYVQRTKGCFIDDNNKKNVLLPTDMTEEQRSNLINGYSLPQGASLKSVVVEWESEIVPGTER